MILVEVPSFSKSPLERLSEPHTCKGEMVLITFLMILAIVLEAVLLMVLILALAWYKDALEHATRLKLKYQQENNQLRDRLAFESKLP